MKRYASQRLHRLGGLSFSSVTQCLKVAAERVCTLADDMPDLGTFLLQARNSVWPHRCAGAWQAGASPAHSRDRLPRDVRGFPHSSKGIGRRDVTTSGDEPGKIVNPLLPTK